MNSDDADSEAAFENDVGPFGQDRGERGLWIRRRLPSGWVLALRFLLQDREPRIAELRLFPEVEPGGDPSDGLDVGSLWEREVDRTDGRPEIPAGGIDFRLIGELSLAADRRAAERRFASVVNVGEAKEIREVRLPSLDFLRRRFWELEEQLGPPRKGRARPDEYYALISAVYESGLDKDPRRPLRFVEQQLEIRKGRIRDALHRARVRGLLSQGSHGRAGGVLTEKGQRVLNDSVNNHGDVDLQQPPPGRHKEKKDNR